MGAQQLLVYNKTIQIDHKELLQVQNWLEKPSEIVLKHARKEESGDITTLSTFRFPIDKTTSLIEALAEAEKTVSLNKEIEAALVELFRKFPGDKVEEVFARVKASRIGMPE